MINEFAMVRHVLSEPIGAVDAGHRLAPRDIQDQPAAAERVDAVFNAMDIFKDEFHCVTMDRSPILKVNSLSRTQVTSSLSWCK